MACTQPLFDVRVTTERKVIVVPSEHFQPEHIDDMWACVSAVEDALAGEGRLTA